MTGQQLKNSILQLAVQGKLVPQDPNDEPASVLLERIRKEKEKLIAEGKIKKEKNPSVIFRGADNLPYEKVGKNDPVCIADEVPFDIPDSWEWCRLKSVAFVNGGYAFKSYNYTEMGYRVIRISDFNEEGFVNTKIVRHPFDESLNIFLLKNKDILLCMTGGTVGKSLFVKELSEPMLTNQRVATIRSLGILEEYLYMVILSPITQAIITLSKNSTNDNISMDTINDFYIPLPPLEEQERIVNQYNKILPFIDDYNSLDLKINSLNNSFPELLKKSILQEAVQGKLVPQDENDEPASVLLERIRAEKQRLIKEGKIKKDKNESVIFRRDNSHYEKSGNIERCIDDEIPFDIPDKWCWARLGTISTYAQPKRKINAQNADKSLWGLDLEDIEKGGKIISYKTVGERSSKGDKTVFCKGDVLYSKLRPYLLKILVAPNDGICTSEIVPFHFYGDIYNKFIVLFLKSPTVDNYINSITYGVKMPRVGTDTMTNLLVPVPPITEQMRIVKQTEKLLPMLS